MKERKKIETVLTKYVPAGFESMVANLIFSAPLRFKVAKPRKSKLGDYRPPFDGKPHRITVNGNLNPYAFLITTLHEFAHMNAQIKFGNRIAPHGKEWKHEFKYLLTPLLASEQIPEDLKVALDRSMRNISASTCTDLELSRVLKRYDAKEEKLVLLEELGNNKPFKLGKQLFERGELKRKRYLCKEINTGKMYLVNRLAAVEPIEKQL